MLKKEIKLIFWNLLTFKEISPKLNGILNKFVFTLFKNNKNIDLNHQTITKDSSHLLKQILKFLGRKII